MKSSAKNIKLASVDDLFSTDESRSDVSREKVVEIPLSELHSFKNHPFKVKDDDAATIIMVDNDLQREELLPSERAFAYKMKLVIYAVPIMGNQEAKISIGNTIRNC